MLNICVAGATGWVGRHLVKVIDESPDLAVAGAAAPSCAGKNLGVVLGIPGLKMSISSSVAEALNKSTDIMVDFTKPEVVKRNVIEAVRKHIHVVIGTSGLTEKDYTEIDRLAREQKVGVLAAGNFAITAVLLMKFAENAAKYVPSWEIIDYAHAHKPDAPSGTARELAHRLSNIKNTQKSLPIEQTLGLKNARGADLNGTQIHSVRLPGYVLSAEVIFGAPNEKLTLRHDSYNSPEPYVMGTLLAIRKVSSFIGLKRGLDSILDF